MSVIELSEAKQLDEFTSKGSVVLLNFWAGWHPPCVTMGKVFKELAADNPGLKFVQIEAEKFPEVCEKYPLQSVPTFIALQNGKVAEVLEEASAPKLVALAKKFVKVASASVAATPAATTDPAADAEALNARLSKLVRAAPVMIFMKGEPSNPRCKFSRELTGLLKEENIRYGYFDIFTDDAVREGLKTYSNWKTFPQIYANGKLVGGLDIFKELREEGELDSVLPKEAKKEDLNKRLKEVINQERVMLFMKGSPDAPECGFSKKMISMLQECQFEFGYFNILLDQDVRQGLKTYSNWKTFPQLYVEGELIGGLDVCLEMHGEGELADLAKVK